MLLPEDAIFKMGCGEFLWSHALSSYTEQAFACVSGRIANSMLNRMLHRNSDIDSIKLRTMTDMVEREGSKIIGDMREYGFRILKEHDWNPETGLPEENAFIEPGIPAKDGDTNFGAIPPRLFAISVSCRSICFSEHLIKFSIFRFCTSNSFSGQEGRTEPFFSINTYTCIFAS